MPLLLNLQLNALQFVEDDEYARNKEMYKKIGATKLKQLMYTNYKTILRIINNHGPEKLYHLSTKPLGKILNTSGQGTTYIGDTNLYYHPVGLYVSCGARFFLKGKSLHYSYVYEIVINTNVLRINTLNEFEAFIDRYKYPDNRIRIHDVLNWKKIKREYDGILICPLLGKTIFGKTKPLLDIYEDENVIHEKIIEKYGEAWKNKMVFLAEWYRHWGSEGVVWRPSGIVSVTLVAKTEV